MSAGSPAMAAAPDTKTKPTEAEVGAKYTCRRLPPLSAARKRRQLTWQYAAISMFTGFTAGFAITGAAVLASGLLRW